ncbi:DUF3060 domain-containing protein [Streptomyces sp. R33]|uniref:DUF3060 domain-containing protein n=1 Tax=Streptomyces sp. R33 TaxID=3238629 RepID=A0AB39YJD7_9ACTN
MGSGLSQYRGRRHRLQQGCGTVTVSGSHNSIYVESADILTVRGDVNGVAVKTVSTLRVEGLINTAITVMGCVRVGL